jgi:hypothetical protein
MEVLARLLLRLKTYAVPRPGEPTTINGPAVLMARPKPSFGALSVETSLPRRTNLPVALRS